MSACNRPVNATARDARGGVAWPLAAAVAGACAWRLGRRARLRDAPAPRRSAAAVAARRRAGQVALILPLSALRQCRPRRTVDAQRRRDGARGIQQSQHPAPGEGRRRHRAGRAGGRAAGARRGRRDHPRAAVRAFGRRRRAGRARARRAGDRVLHRRQRRGARRLSAELPARNPTSTASSATRSRRASARSRRWCPTMPMASWCEAAFQQAVARGGGRVVALERYPARPAAACRSRCAASRRPPRAPTRSSFRTAPMPCRPWCRRLRRAASIRKRIQLLGTGPVGRSAHFRRSRSLQGGWFAAPDAAGFRAFSARYRARTGKTRCAPRRSPTTRSRWSPRWSRRRDRSASTKQVLTNSSGFAGIDGMFRFRPDGTNQRGLAVLRVTPERRAGREPRAEGRSRLGDVNAD